MKVINYTALKKNRGQYLQAKSRRKKPQTQFQKHQIQEIFELFFVNSRSVKSVRGGKKISCRPFREREKKSSSKKAGFNMESMLGFTSQ